MDRARLDSQLEKGILGLVTLVLFLGPILFGSTPGYAVILHEGLIGCAMVLWAIRVWIRPEYRILWPPFAWFVVAFVGYAIWQLNRADVTYLARQDVRLVILYGALFFLIVDNLNRQEWTQFLVSLVIFTGMVMAMYAIYQFISRSRWVLWSPQHASYYGRASGTFVCPNHLAAYIGMALPAAFAMTLMARFKPIFKVALGYAGIVMLVGLILTVSRAGIAAGIFGLLILFTILAFNRDWRIPAIVALVLILAPAIWFAATSSILQTRVQKAFASKETPLDDRMYIWPAATSMFRENFWTGVGPNHYDTHFRKYRPELQQLQAAPGRAHNEYINTLADWGFTGFALITTAFGVFFLGVTRIWRFVRRANDFGKKTSTRAAIVLGLTIGLVTMLAHVLFEFSMHIPALAMLAVTWLAIITSHWRFATERFWVRPGTVGRVVATVVLAAGIGWIAMDAVRSAQEAYYLAKSNRPGLSNEARLEFLKKSFATGTGNPDTAYEIGETLRMQAWLAVGNYRAVAEEAIKWFDLGIALNPFDPHSYLGKGMTLHWIDRHSEAWPYFRDAIRLDRNSYYARALYGWHFVQLEAWAPASKWFRKSWDIAPVNNPIVKSYWPIVERKIRELDLPLEFSKPLPEPAPTVEEAK